MPKRGTQQNLRNFQAISHRPEPLAVVNAELLFGNSGTGSTVCYSGCGMNARFSSWNESRFESPGGADTLRSS